MPNPVKRSRNPSFGGPKEDTKDMLYWAAVFFVIAIVAAVFGFAGIAGSAAWVAQILFVVFIVLFLISLLTGRHRPIA
jgi:uncharacterized membrane protein YtjA (UPF0391 family)